MFVVKIALSLLLLFSQPQSASASEVFDRSLVDDIKSSDELVLRGNQLYVEGRSLMAIGLYSQALEKNPENLTAFFNRGVARFQLLEVSNAIADFTHVIDQSPDFVPALHARATAYRQNDQLDKALADNNLTIEYEPYSAHLLHGRALTLRALDRVGEAIVDLDRAIQADVSFAPAFKVRADIYFELGSTEQALADYLNAYIINPQDYDTTYNVGLSLSVLGQFLHAIEAYSRVIEVYPDHMPSLMSRADSLRLVNEHSRALIDINHAIDVTPELGEAYRIRALIYLELGKKVDAASDFETAARIDQVK